MRRIYEDYAYSDEGRSDCYWDSTVTARRWPVLQGTHQADVAIIGAGYTGLNAAIELAAGGASVIVLDAEWPGWGASGRNGGFCCMGGAKASDAAIARRYGQGALDDWDTAQVDAINLVARRVSSLSLDVEQHSDGEIVLAHSRYAMKRLQRSGETVDRAGLAAMGINGPQFHGGLHTRVGFGLNPRRYLEGLARHAASIGVNIYGNSPMTRLKRGRQRWHAVTPDGWVEADQILIATNGYSSEDLPDWMAARYLPALSSVMVTRPLTQAEQQAQGWTSDLMAYDTRTLLHYFRLMPNGRFLFGMRGGVTCTPRAEAVTRRRLRTHFEQMFPAWRHVEATHTWSGLVCLMPALVPFAGEVPDMPGVHAAMGWHGNGVAMGSYAGASIAGRIAGTNAHPLPEFTGRTPTRFPLRQYRRSLLRLAYLGYSLTDAL